MRAPGSKGAPSDKDLKNIRASSVKEGWQDEFADMVGQMKKSGRLGMPKSNYNFKTPEPKSKEELMSRLKELEAEFDPAYQQSDDYSFWKKQNDIASEISSIRRQLRQQGVAEGLSDIVKGIKRKVAGKDNPKDVEHTYARIARRDIEDANKLNNQAAYDARDKSTKRWEKVNKVVNKQGAAEGSEPQVGDAVYYGKRLVGWFKGYSEHGKIITEPNYEEMGDEYANRDVYWDSQDKITIKPEQGVAEGQEDLEEATSMKQQWKNDVKQVHGNNVRFEVNKAVRSNEETQSEAYDENGNKVAYFYHKSGRQNILPKPKVNEDLSKTDIKKQISKFEELALAANRAGDDEKSKQYQRKIQSLKQKMSQDVKEGQGGVMEGDDGQVVFSGTGANGGKYEIIHHGDDFMIHANGKHIDSYGSLQRAMSVLKNEVPGLKQGVAEGIKGWKHAHSDMMKHRAESGKDVHLVSLKKDGTESKMHDAKKSFKSEEEARAHHKRVKELNPNRTIAHNLYVGGKVEKLS
jgi:hypothetical protein